MSGLIDKGVVSNALADGDPLMTAIRVGQLRILPWARVWCPNDVEDVLQGVAEFIISRWKYYDESKSKPSTFGYQRAGQWWSDRSEQPSKQGGAHYRRPGEVPFSIGITPDSNDSAGNSFADRIDMMMLDQSDRMRHYEDLGTRGEEILDCITDNPKGGNNSALAAKSAAKRRAVAKATLAYGVGVQDLAETMGAHKSGVMRMKTEALNMLREHYAQD